MTDVPALPAELVDVEPSIAADLDEAIIAAALQGPYDHDADDEHGNAVERVYGWYPSTLDEAEWCARRLAALDARVREIAVQYAAWVERISDWREGELERVAPGAAFFTSRLKTFGLAQRAMDPKAKTTHLPSGEIKTRHDGRRVEVTDEAALTKWAGDTLSEADYEVMVKTTTKVLLPGLRKTVEIVEIPPLLTPEEWCAVTGVRIMDPDGWRGPEGRPWDDRIDKTEFQLRASVSTTNALQREEPTMDEPDPTWRVVHPKTGDAVPGCGVSEPETTATVTVR